ncbi:acyl-CoA dehydrogenase [Streptomyces hygroscopicus subsp. hygroscopicus]|nr:acyl-CoA dehydrogenase family protein [Streptomyces hygroscopicus]GLX53919.1 acyl-CoA dehydrogenase [Streptomyces hygroscopicus subsp. hygroscopicus]
MPAATDLNALAPRPRLAARYADLLTTLQTHAAEADHHARLPAPVLDALRTSGILATAIPCEHGGHDGGAPLVNRLTELIAEADPSVAIILFQHWAVSTRITEWATAGQRERCLPRLADGRWLAASAWSEQGAGADKRTIRTTAVRVPGGWRLDGTKAFTTGAGLADLYLVLAQSAPPSRTDTAYGSDGQTFFLVEADRPGLTAHASMDLVGMRASATGTVELRACTVPDDAVLGPEGKAADIIRGVRETGASLGAVAVGIAESAYRLACAHTRKHGGPTPQAVRHRLADLAARVAQARAIVDSAGRRDSPDPGTLTLHSKLAASALAEEACLEAQRLIGSAAFLRGHPVNRISRDARAVALMGPTNDLCRELVTTPWN